MSIEDDGRRANQGERRLHLRDDRPVRPPPDSRLDRSAVNIRLVPEGRAARRRRRHRYAAWNSRRADRTKACRWCSRGRPPICRAGHRRSRQAGARRDGRRSSRPIGNSGRSCRATCGRCVPTPTAATAIKRCRRATDYLVIAVQNLEQGQGGDPEFLTRAREEAKPFSLNEGETKAVDIKLSKLVP